MDNHIQYSVVLNGDEVDLELLDRVLDGHTARLIRQSTADNKADRWGFWFDRGGDLPLIEWHLAPRELILPAENSSEINWHVVKSKGLAIVWRVNAIGRLIRDDFGTLQIVGYGMVGLNGVAQGMLRETLPKFPLCEASVRDIDRKIFENWYLLSRLDHAVSFALEAFGGFPVSWHSLYMVFECIRMDEGRESNLECYIDGGLLNNFKSAANNSRSLLEGARHGGRSNIDQKNLIDLDMGYIIIRSLLIKWLNKKSEIVLGS